MPIYDVMTTLLVLAFCGFLVYLLTEKIPQATTFKEAIQALAVVLLVLYLLGLFTGHAALLHAPWATTTR